MRPNVGKPGALGGGGTFGRDAHYLNTCTMRFLLIILLLLVSLVLPAQGIVINLTAGGVGPHPAGDCDKDLPNPDCSLYDGMQEITVAPGELYGFYFAWTNDGAAVFAEVTATDQAGNLLFVPVTEPLNPGQTATISDFANAPTEPGVYTITITFEADDGNERTDTDQFRYFVTVDASLPVQLSEFTAVPAGKNRVDLYWRTGSEVNFRRFVVERSTDGRTFAEVGAVAGAGYGQAAGNYHLQDTDAPAGRVVYRLRLEDTDGSATYSQLRRTTVDGGSLRVYPNPAGGQLRLDGINPDQPWGVYDGLGRMLLNGMSSATAIDLGTLPAGRYWLLVGEERVPFVRR